MCPLASAQKLKLTHRVKAKVSWSVSQLTNS